MKPAAQRATYVTSEIAPGASPGYSKKGSLNFQWLGDPLAADETKEEIVAGLFGAGEIVVVHAHPKSGKSLFAADLAFAIATGSDWFGRAVKRGGVLFCALEKWRVTRKRFRALQRLGGNIRPPIAISPTAINLLSRTSVDGVIAASREMRTASRTPVRLIVFDTLNRAMPGVDENSAGYVGQAFNELTRIADETGAMILVLHHNAKGASGQMRGSSTISASADVVIAIDKMKGDINEATIVSANDIPEGDTFRFRLKTTELEQPANGSASATTVVLEAITDDPSGAHGSAPSRSSKADMDRSRVVLDLVQNLEQGGRVDRAVLLESARAKGVVSSDNPASGAEQLRRALSVLREADLVSFSSREVRLP